MAQEEVAYYSFGEKIFAGNADTLSADVEPLFKSGTASTIVLDLERVKLCDSCGLRLFLNLQRLADAGSRKMILYRPDHILKDLFETTRLTHVFTIVDVLDPAIAAALGR